MAQTDDLKASIKVCMFDQYGTVVDMQTQLTEAAAPFLAAKGWPGNPDSFVTWWRRTHFENSMIDALLHRDHTSYQRSATALSLSSWSGLVFRTRSTRCATSLLISSGCDRFPRYPRRLLDHKCVIRWWFSPMEIPICWKRRSATTELRSTG